MSQRVVQAAVELTTFVVPTEFGLLAAAMVDLGKSLAVSPGEAPQFRPALMAHFPSSAGLADVWPSVAEVESFQSIRPQYVLAAVKAEGRGHPSGGFGPACGHALRMSSLTCGGSSLSLCPSRASNSAGRPCASPCPDRRDLHRSPLPIRTAWSLA